jgi:hypothetical protein
MGQFYVLLWNFLQGSSRLMTICLRMTPWRSGVLQGAEDIHMRGAFLGNGKRGVSLFDTTTTLWSATHGELFSKRGVYVHVHCSYNTVMNDKHREVSFC